MTAPAHPALETLLSEIQIALDNQLYYLALAVSLSVPDICAAAECEPDKIWVNQTKYEAWCTENLEKHFKRITARDIYRLRCGVLHQGNFGRPDERYERIIFVLPNPNFPVHETKFDGTFNAGGTTIKGPLLFVHADRFCFRVMDAVREWYAAKSADANVQANVPDIVRQRPGGFPPIIVGVPVIQ